jgi:hypothetical protein
VPVQLYRRTQQSEAWGNNLERGPKVSTARVVGGSQVKPLNACGRLGDAAFAKRATKPLFQDQPLSHLDLQVVSWDCPSL